MSTSRSLFFISCFSQFPGSVSMHVAASWEEVCMSGTLEWAAQVSGSAMLCLRGLIAPPV